MNDAPLLTRFEKNPNFIIKYFVRLEKLIYIFYSKNIKINLCIKLDASHSLVESRGEKMSKVFYEKRRSSLDSALNSINIEESLILNADQSIINLISKALKEIINSENKK